MKFMYAVLTQFCSPSHCRDIYICLSLLSIYVVPYMHIYTHFHIYIYIYIYIHIHTYIHTYCITSNLRCPLFFHIFSSLKIRACLKYEVLCFAVRKSHKHHFPQGTNGLIKRLVNFRQWNVFIIFNFRNIINL